MRKVSAALVNKKQLRDLQYRKNIGMVTTYGGFKLFTLPRAGGHFVRLRVQHWPHRKREAPFTETGVFESEAGAIQEAKRLVDDASLIAQAASAA